MTESQSSLVKHQRGDGEPLEAHARAVWQAVSTFLCCPLGGQRKTVSPPQPTLDANAADLKTFSVATEDPQHREGIRAVEPGVRAWASLVKTGTERPLRTTQ